jgi:hypothetical protein
MPPDHPALTEQDVLARGGWHPRYARVLALASDGGYGFAVVDGNGDGAELEAETWIWRNGTWTAGSSSGAGPLDGLGPVQTGGSIDDAYFAFGRAPGRRVVTIEFDGHLYQIPVSRHGTWAFIRIRTDSGRPGLPAPVTGHELGGHPGPA